MKILHCIAGIQKAAGTTTFCVRVAEESAKLGHEVAIVVMAKRPETDAKTAVLVLEWIPGTELPFIPDVMHIHGLWTPWLSRVQHWAQAQGIKVVLSPHGMLAPWAMAHKRWKKMLPWMLYQKRNIRKADVIHVTSAQEERWVRDLGFTNKIIEVPLGTDLPSKTATHDFPVKYVVFVGRIYPVKGLDLLIKAWAQLKTRPEAQGWHAVLVGPNQAGHMEELEALAASLGVTTRRGDVAGIEDADVTFTGPLYGEAKNEVVRKARLAILPSYTENFGGVVIDALALGVPVLASSKTPWDRLAEAGCGASFEVNADVLVEHCIEWMRRTDTMRSDCGTLGKTLVASRYTWVAVGDKLTAVYVNL